MEPTFATAPELLAVLEELKRREPLFHRPQLGRTRRDYENMMTEDFWEVGASGRRYSREFVLQTLQHREPDPEEAHWTLSDCQCRELAADHYLFTYTLAQGQRITRRATLWRRSGSSWRALYHQGTVVEHTPAEQAAPER